MFSFAGKIVRKSMAKPHVLIIPFPAQGHVIPLMQLAHSLVDRGIRVTFVNTEIIHSQLPDNDHDRIHLVAIPDGLESDEERRIPGRLGESVFRAMPAKLEQLILETNASSGDRISCLIADVSLGWAQGVARKLGIRPVAFLPAAAATLVLGFNIPRLVEEGIIDEEGTPIRKQVVQLAPGMPLMNSEEFVWARLGTLTMQKFIFQAIVQSNQVLKNAEWLISNSATELEPGAFSVAPEIVPIGPLPAINRPENPTDDPCLKWLDNQPNRSVIYVAFGTTSVHSEPQLEELALGLELTNRPFLWVCAGNLNSRAISSRGRVVARAPQQRVLSHPAVGCFVSHCGWNSVVDSVGCGVPLLCWPYFADQFINQSYVCDVWKVGLGFKRDGGGLITGEEIKDKIEELLGSVTCRERALHFQETVGNSAREGGSSYKNFTKFETWLKAIN